MNNLHVINYSTPQNKEITKNKLLKNLYFIKKLSKRYSLYNLLLQKLGILCNKKQYDNINKNYKNSDIFKVKITSKFKKYGNLHYGELLIPKIKKEILLSTYICHPSMANNELSGPLLSIALYKYLKKKKIIGKIN